MKAETHFEPHDVIWTGDKVRRFWDYLGSSEAHESSYFSNQAGDAVINMVLRRVPLHGRRILDFGCGPGFLVEKLLARKICTEAMDSSPASIESLYSRVRGNSFFRGAVVAAATSTPLASETYDVVFFLEIVEHLVPDDLQATVAELNRITRTGGHLVVTTRNEEDLGANTTICPDCGCRFHRRQHVASWSPSRLSSFMYDHGFDPVMVKTATFWPDTRLPMLFNLASTIRGSKKVNLMYIGRKR